MRVIPFLFLFVITSGYAQDVVEAPRVKSEEFQQMLDELLNLGMPAISVEELSDQREHYVVLDSREREEYETSHIPGAKWIGYSSLRNQVLKEIPKDQKIVVYCSVGYRSERVTYQLKRRGFTDVVNLHGSLFEWANQGHAVENAAGEATNQIHTYSKKWSEYLLNSDYEAIW